MPYITDRLAIKDPFLDKRVKLIPCQKEMVIFHYKNGMSINKIAKLFNVSKRLIQFEIFPERKAIDLQNRLDRGGSMIYYKGGKEWAEQIKNHRKYKYNLLKNTIHTKQQN